MLSDQLGSKDHNGVTPLNKVPLTIMVTRLSAIITCNARERGVFSTQYKYTQIIAWRLQMCGIGWLENVKRKVKTHNNCILYLVPFNSKLSSVITQITLDSCTEMYIIYV